MKIQMSYPIFWTQDCIEFILLQINFKERGNTKILYRQVEMNIFNPSSSSDMIKQDASNPKNNHQMESVDHDQASIKDIKEKRNMKKSKYKQYQQNIVNENVQTDSSSAYQNKILQKIQTMMTFTQFMNKKCDFCQKPIKQAKPKQKVVVTQCKHVFCQKCIRTQLSKYIRQTGIARCPKRGCGDSLDKQSQGYKNLKISESNSDKVQPQTKMKREQTVNNVNNPEQKKSKPTQEEQTNDSQDSQGCCSDQCRSQCTMHCIVVLGMIVITWALFFFAVIYIPFTIVTTFGQALFCGPRKLIDKFREQEKHCLAMTICILYPIMSVILAVFSVLKLFFDLIFSPLKSTKGFRSLWLDQYRSLRLRFND